MPVDASIAMGVRAPQIENPLNALAQAMQLQGMQRQGELQGLQVQQAKQGMADEQAARQVISANQDAAPQDLIRKLRVVNPAMALKMEAAQIDADLKRSQTKEHSAKGDELVAKMAKAKQDQMAAMAGSLSSLDQVPEFLNQMVAESSGKVTPDQVKKLQAAFAADFQGTKQRLLEQAMSPDALQKMRQPDFVEMFDGKNKFFFDRNPFSTTPDNKRRMGEVQMQATIAEQETARANRERERNQAGQLAVSQGQLGVAQSNLGLKRQEVENGKWSNDLERGIQVNMSTGETRPITEGGNPVGLKAKPFTESQGKDAGFALRMEESDKILSALDGKYSSNALAYKNKGDNFPVVGPNVGAWMNKRMTQEERSAFQAQKNFLNAVLRRESGAMISVSEFSDGVRQYFPQDGDTPTDLAQKAAARRQAYAGIKVSAGPAYEAAKKEYGSGKQTESALPKPMSAAERDALPKGTRYIAPDGTEWTKK